MFSIDHAAWVIAALLVVIAGLVDASGHVVEVLASVAVAAFTFYLAVIARRANKHFRVTERAYVKLSHRPPGLYWETSERPKVFYQKGDHYWIRCDLRVKNFGKTPSAIYEVRAGKKITGEADPGPQEGDYSEILSTPDAFLVTKDEFTQPIRMEISREEFHALRSGEQRLYLFAYVEYQDKFGDRHRGSYARQYAREIDLEGPVTVRTNEPLLRDEKLEGHNNLTFVNQRGLNSDVTQNFWGQWV